MFIKVMGAHVSLYITTSFREEISEGFQLNEYKKIK